MATSTMPVVTLTSEQRDALCDLTWDEVEMRMERGRQDALRMVRAGVRLFDALEWTGTASNNSDRTTYELPVCDDVQWLASEVLQPSVNGPQILQLATDLGELPAKMPEVVADTPEARDWYIAQIGDRLAYEQALASGTRTILAAGA